MAAWRWWNFWIPLGLGLLLAGSLSDLPTSGWTERQALGWLVIAVGWPLFTFFAVGVVGFLCGIVGYQPYEMSQLFSRWWGRGRSGPALRRTAKKRTAVVDAQRWSVVAHLLEPGEVRIENTPCRLLDPDGKVGVPDLVLYLTDRAVLLGKPGQCTRVALSDIPYAEVKQGPGKLQLWMSANLKDKVDERSHLIIDTYPSPISAGLINTLLRTLKERAGDGTQ